MVSFDFVPSTTTQVPDAAGLWIFEAGQVGWNYEMQNYTCVRRAVFDPANPPAQLSGAVTLTVFTTFDAQPASITLQGTFSYPEFGRHTPLNPGAHQVTELGSVSASSADGAAFLGFRYSRSGATGEFDF